MKKLNYSLSFIAIIAMLFTSCSKEETSSTIDDTSTESAQLTFGAMLDNLANRAMNKGHFGQVPTCSDAEPSVAVIEISYGSTTKTVDVEIKSDASGYFTAYSEDLKIPTPTGGSTAVTLSSFMVYDGDTSSGAVSGLYYSSVYGNLIWIAPKFTGTDDQQFAGYVDNPLPHVFDVSAGTKPYIDVDVLCFDRRMANEYGYVFFDIEEKELIELCLFGNICSPEGRHYVASFSTDVWLLKDDGTKGTQLYDGEINNYDSSNSSASPLCLVLPDDLDKTDTYYVEITLLDDGDSNSNQIGTVVKTLTITDTGVRTFFNSDMVTQEYAHFFVGCDEDDIFDEPGSDSYFACLRPLNRSGAIAIASLSLDGNALSVVVLGTGFKAGEMHPQHIHGFTGDDAGQNAVCPPSTAGGDDNIISVAEGAPFYGGIQLPLDITGAGDFPIADATGSYFYSRTFNLTAAQMENITPLEQMVIVAHGIVVNGSYSVTTPAACSEVESSGSL
jgi:hypothetical protein